MRHRTPLLAMLLATLGTALSAERPAFAGVDFNREIRPILSENCFACHGPDEPSRKAKLRLDMRVGATAARGADPAAIAPGKPDSSPLIARIASNDPDEIMPPPKSGKRLTAAQIDTIRRWIGEGAEWGMHWSFVAPVRSSLPVVKNEQWPVNAIDRFVLAKLEAAGLQPSPPAEKAVLLRRVYFDVIGLPPSPAEVEAFLADDSPAAYERVVDRLLASPAFGEKWGRQWLDLARYADSNGYQRDGFRTIWPWRDWVIKSLNAGLPYDRFLAGQLAGDLMPGATADQRVATGFFRNTTVNVEAGTIPEADRTKQVADRVSMFGTVFLGLTIECAQCHDHKFDPISTRDYYRLFAYFNNTPIESKHRGKDAPALDFIDGPSIVVGGTQADLARQSELKAKLAVLVKDCAADPDKATLAQMRELEKQIEAIPVVASLIMEELPRPRETHVLKRGQFDSPGEIVAPGTPAALHPLDPSQPPNRLALAAWVADAKNPLTGRVAVNRWWAELFGRGIVPTLEDFGAKGDPPSHPVLLDWLAVELRENGWSMKHMIRLMVTSRTYQQSARTTGFQPVLQERITSFQPVLHGMDAGNHGLEARGTDSDNALLSRGPRLRLPAEAVRDNALAIAGLLSRKQFGPPVFPPQPADVWRVIGKVDNTYRASTGDDRYRRGIYTIWRRSAPYPSFLSFDATDRSSCVVKRAASNTPLQALTLLNDPVYTEAAAALAKRITADKPSADAAERIKYAFCLCVSRAPREPELQYLLDAFSREKAAKDEPAAWQFIATVLLNLDETISK